MKPHYESIFKIFVDSVEYDILHPWHMQHHTFSGTAFCIELNNIKYLLTCNHVLSNNPIIILKSPWGDSKVEVVKRDPICDIALLSIPEKSKIYRKMKPLSIGSAVAGDVVYTQGFPLDYRGLAVSRGLLSRLTKMYYVNGWKGLVLQMDATISPGSSGGALLNAAAEVIGITFRSDDSGANTFFSIPFFIIRHFLKQVFNEGPVCYSFLPKKWQVMTEEMRTIYGNGCILLNDTETVFSSIENIEIHNSNEIRYEDMLHYLGFNVKSDEMIAFHYLIQFVESKRILLDKKHYDLETVSLKVYDPSYIQYNGFIFIPVNEYTIGPIMQTYNTTPTTGIFITDIFETFVNREYIAFRGKCVTHINDKKVTIENFHSLLTKKINIFTLDNDSRKIFIDKKKAKANTDSIARYLKML